MELKRAEGAEVETLTGPVFETQVHKREGVTEDIGDDISLSVSEIVFAPGERTAMHTHTIRQVLVITGGEGILKSVDEQFEVTAGDIISIPPDEEHWHGATEDSEFRHISIVARDPTHGGTIAVAEK